MARKTENTITVQVTGQPVCEDGIHHAKGETFQTTRERAEALGDLVTEAVDPPSAEEKAEG